MPAFSTDQHMFSPTAISKNTAKINWDIENLLRDLPPAWELGAETVRARRRAGEGLLGFQPAHPDARWINAEALGRTVPLRIFSPHRAPKGILLHIHGGGHTLGSAEAQDQTLWEMAERLGIAVASIEYRLAPEAPYPAGPDDCETAALWLIENAAQEFGTDHLVIMGESAGAHLAASTLLRTRDRLGACPFRAASLFYGQFDLSGTPSAHGWGERNLVINTPIVRWFNANFLPPTTYSRSDIQSADISPLYADLAGLCPALFSCGTLDPLVDDSLLMAQRWGAAGNVARLDMYPGGIHIFNLIEGCDIGDDANLASDKWLMQHLGG